MAANGVPSGVLNLGTKFDDWVRVSFGYVKREKALAGSVHYSGRPFDPF